MNAKLKEDWVKALRSGEYRQTQNILRDGECFCCLGVLCEVAHIDFDEDAYSLVRRLTGGYAKFVLMNDVQRKSFPEIADYIEEHL